MAYRFFTSGGIWSANMTGQGTVDSQEGNRWGHTAQESMCIQVSPSSVIDKVGPRAKQAGPRVGWPAGTNQDVWGKFATT